jgi:hypothetical protein
MNNIDNQAINGYHIYEPLSAGSQDASCDANPTQQQRTPSIFENRIYNA